MSRDEQNVLVVSYAELKNCLEQSFGEVNMSSLLLLVQILWPEGRAELRRGKYVLFAPIGPNIVCSLILLARRVSRASAR